MPSVVVRSAEETATIRAVRKAVKDSKEEKVSSPFVSEESTLEE